MSKLSFRARALDASKPMPVFRCEEIPDLPDFAAINRAVPQMPTGMEKEEECEHHLQRAISAQQAYGQTGDLVIPTPEVYTIDGDYERLYPSNYKIPRQLIHMQPFTMEQDIPDYDMDTEDEEWVNQQAKKMDLTPLQFEEMMDRLEKGSGQHVVQLKEAKLLLKEDDDLIIAVYDYWLNKRLRTQHPLILQVRNEKRDGSTNNNPYVAFRRRTEKMQTRKNRKNDEASYEKMLKLRRDLSRAVTLLEMVKRREKTKREHLHLSVEVFEKRYQAGDFSGHLLAELSAMKHPRPVYVPVHPVSRPADWLAKTNREETGLPRKKREYKKRKHKQAPSMAQMSNMSPYHDVDAYGDMISSEDDTLSPGVPPSDQEDESDPDGPFAFRRKKSCNYHAPILDTVGNWPWCSHTEGGFGDKRYRYCLTSLSLPRPRCVGFARRRLGRGGRILLDRAWTPLDNYLDDLDSILSHSVPNGLHSNNEFLQEIKNEWLHFRPQTPPPHDCTSDTTSDCGASSPGSPDEEERVTNTPEFNVDSYHTHHEELLAMQRRQMERLRQDDAEHSPSNPSLFTLDSASVQFAVSAVVNTHQVGALATPTTNTVTTTAPGTNGLTMASNGSLPLVNGPTLDSNSNENIPCVDVTCTSELVDSQSSSSTCPLPSFASSSSSPSTSSVTGANHPVSVLAAKAVTPQSVTEIRIAQMAHNKSHSVSSDNQDDKVSTRVKIENLVNENSLPMEVT
uniref:Enhancer of polycomb-like protein n=1 Tax=Strigamia maritima TaxID=126957 RepID=T1JAR8_STRMM